MAGAAVSIDAAVVELTDDAAIGPALELIYRRRRRSVPPVGIPWVVSISRLSCDATSRVDQPVLHAVEEIPWDERVEIAPLPV
jgi:hypothetical protein